jgi:hypothetical protein
MFTSIFHPPRLAKDTRFPQHHYDHLHHGDFHAGRLDARRLLAGWDGASVVSVLTDDPTRFRTMLTHSQSTKQGSLRPPPRASESNLQATLQRHYYPPRRHGREPRKHVQAVYLDLHDSLDRLLSHQEARRHLPRRSSGSQRDLHNHDLRD